LLSTLEGPLEGTQEHCNLDSEVSYSYRQVLGEIIYAYVVCRLDIGYAATILSRFSQAPAREHYKALKDIVKYLWCTVDWGIIYWRQNPVDSLPRINVPDVPIDPSLPTFPTHNLLWLTGYVDAAHATDLKTRCSISGYVFTLAGGAVAFKSKLQATVATSSTKAEFMAAVSAAKVAKYL
jgi:KUP system potassium uptake protein